MKHKLLIAALAVIAAVLAAVHLCLPYGTQTRRMDASAARKRSGERMDVILPQGTVDINRGTAEELTQLTGVGPVLAQAIIAEREQNGDFHYPQDLLNVQGIGSKTLNKMLEQLQLPERHSESGVVQ